MAVYPAEGAGGAGGSSPRGPARNDTVSNEVPAGSCPFRVDRPVMRQRWDRLTFLHWSFEPDEVARLLPDGLEPDLFEGRAWVGLVPFFMHVATGRGRMLPWVSRFPETNVRTYVRNADGLAGIWFFSLDAARLGAVAVARSTYRLPYFWSSMDVESSGETRGVVPPDQHSGGTRGVVPPDQHSGGTRGVVPPDQHSGGEIFYRCRRRLPDPPASSVTKIAIGERLAAHEIDEREHFLTARWILFSVAGSGSRRRLARAYHEPWPLHRAQASTVEDGLLVAAGLPEPVGPPLVHYSPGVDVAIGRPERCR